MKKLLIILLFSISSFGQLLEPPINVQSPSVASIGKYGDLPSNNYTGIASITIPITEISEGQIKLPISYSQTTTGFKPDVHPGWVGLNGNLNAGGVVSRTVKGVPDDNPNSINSPADGVVFEQGYFFPNIRNLLNVSNWDQQSMLPNYAYNKLDEPDEFSFSCPAGSGKFYKDAFSTLIKVQSENNLKVEFIFVPNTTSIQTSRPPFCRPTAIGSGIWDYNCTTPQSGDCGYLQHVSGFKVTDEMGVQYIFGSSTPNNINAIEYSIDFFSQRKDSWIANAWFLTKIIDKNGNEINFTYERKELISQMYISVATADKDVKWVGNKSILSVWNECSSWSAFNTPAQGIYAGKLVSPVYLKEINAENTKLVFNNSQTIELRYEDDVFIDYYNWYMSPSNPKPSSTGIYDVFPYLHSCVYDYNNLPTTFCTAPTYCSNEADIPTLLNRLQWRKLDNIQVFDKVSGSLKRQYNFTYTNNINERLKLINISEIYGATNKGTYSFNYYSDNTVTIPKYLKSHTDHWGFNNNLPINKTNDLSTGSHPTYGSTLRIPATDVKYLNVETLSNITYPTGGKTYFDYGLHTYSKRINENARWDSLITENATGGGLRIKKITSYDATTQTIKNEKEYFYISGFNPSNGNTSLTSSGILGHTAKYYVGSVSFYNAPREQISTLSNQFSSQSVYASGENATGAPIGYSEVVEKISSGANTSGWNVYKYTNFDTNPDQQFQNTFQSASTPYEPFNSKALERGKLLSQEIFTTSGNLVKKNETTYEAINTDFVKAIRANYFFECSALIPYYRGTAYKIFTYKYLPKTETIIEYDISNPNNSLSTTTTFNYNNLGQLTEKYFTETDGSINRAKNKFVSDYSFPSLTLCQVTWLSDHSACDNISDAYGQEQCRNLANVNRTNCLNQPMYKEAAAIVSMQQKNILPPIEQINTKEKSGTISTKGIITLFEDFGTEGGLQPKEIRTLQIAQAASIPFSSIDGNKSFVYDANYTNSQLVFNKYDNKGNPLEISRKGNISSYLWGYNQLLPIAEIKNATYATAIASLGSGDLTALNLGYYLNGQNKVSYTDLEMNAKMNPLKGLSNALATTYTYDRINGLTSTVSPNDLITYFEYDDFKRLKTIKDHNGKPIKGYNYKIGASNTVTEIIPRLSIATSTIDFTTVDAITSTNTSSYTSFQDTYQLSKSYFDGLGRPLQTVAYKAGGTGATLNDIVTNGTGYDIFGRATKSYIPFVGTGALEFTALPNPTSGETKPFSEITVFDNSALNRPLITFGPGSAWRVNANNANASKMEYAISPANTVRRYEINGNDANNIGTYSSSLYKTVSISEQGNKLTEYKDNIGRVIQKDVELRIKDRPGENGSVEIASTAYVYDDFGQLRFVVQPKAFATGAHILDSDLKLIFAYKYDDKGRVTEKQIPGGGKTCIVYDSKDRPVMTQNALQAGFNKWTYTKYDALNRDIESGEQIFVANPSRFDLQTLFNGLSGEAFPATGVFSPTVTTPTVASIRVKKYYDTQSESIGANNFHNAYSNYKGLLAKTQTSVYDDAGLYSINNSQIGLYRSWLPYDNYFFYDEKGRIIQTKNRHHLSASPDITNFEYNFTGEVLQKRVDHFKNSSSIYEIVTNTYDHLGRILTVNHNVNGNSKNIAKYNYDNLGRLSKKEIQPGGNYSFSRSSNVTSTNSGNYNTNSIWSPSVIPGIGSNVTINNSHTISVPNNERGISKYITNNGTITLGGTASVLSFDDCNIANASNMANLQTIDYNYHLRGWLKGINETMSTAEADLFSYKLDYETAPAGFERYDGNIGKQTWKNCEAERSYTFTYDKASRLLASTYSNINAAGENYSLSDMTYDVNGNIITLKRNGKNGTSLNAMIDNLTYAYNGNRLLSVSDGVSGNENIGDFRNDAANSNLDYEYTDNGNLLSDSNEGIGSITYDTYLNQPILLNAGVGKNIYYRYDGAGNLLQTEYSNGEKWDFVNGLIYKKASTDIEGTLYQISTAEGRYLFEGNQFEYDYKDHLGNTRLSFKEQNGKLIKTAVTNFDPWGMVLKGIGSNNTTENRWELQGHEKENTFGLNRIQFGARTYNPTIGRWDGVDPLALLDFNLSPYTFVSNNPIMRIDLWGLTDVNYDGIDDGTTLNVNVEVKAKRTKSDPMLGDYFINAARNSEKRRVQGDKYISYSWTKKEIETGLKIEVAVATAIYSGSAAVATEGIALLSEIEVASAGRWLLKKAISSKSIINLGGQIYSNYLKGEKRFDIAGFLADLGLSNIGSATVGGIGEIGWDFEAGNPYYEINSPVNGSAKFFTGAVFGSLSDGIGAHGGNYILESAIKLYQGIGKSAEEYINVQADSYDKQRNKK